MGFKISVIFCKVKEGSVMCVRFLFLNVLLTETEEVCPISNITCMLNVLSGFLANGIPSKICGSTSLISVFGSILLKASAMTFCEPFL